MKELTAIDWFTAQLQPYIKDGNLQIDEERLNLLLHLTREIERAYHTRKKLENK
jgi:hypothetical protein